jgi:hypothetical protein
MLGKTRGHLVADCKPYRGHSLGGRPMLRRLKGKILSTRWATSLVYLLTVHYRFHILHKTVDDLKRLGCGYPGLVHAKPV